MYHSQLPRDRHMCTNRAWISYRSTSRAPATMRLVFSRGKRSNRIGRDLIDFISHCDNHRSGHNEKGTGEELEEQRQGGRRRQHEQNNGPSHNKSTDPTNLTNGTIMDLRCEWQITVRSKHTYESKRKNELPPTTNLIRNELVRPATQRTHST